MKRILTLLLTALLLLPLISCSSSELDGNLTPETTAETEDIVTTEEEKPTGPIPQSETEKKKIKILVLGDSHTNDVFFQLARVFNAQGFENRYTIGFLYYSSCSILQHVDFGTMNKKAL